MRKLSRNVRLRNFKRLALILGVQWIFVAASIRFDHSVNWLAGLTALLALLVPFAGNIWALDDAPLSMRSCHRRRKGVVWFYD